MVLQDPRLAERVKATVSQKLMKHPKTNRALKAISSECYSKHGLNVSFFLADEVHAWPTADGRRLFRVVTDLMIKRDCSPGWCFSTSDYRISKP